MNKNRSKTFWQHCRLAKSLQINEARKLVYHPALLILTAPKLANASTFIKCSSMLFSLSFSNPRLNLKTYKQQANEMAHLPLPLLSRDLLNLIKAASAWSLG